MFRTIRSRIYLINIVFLILTFFVLILSTILFVRYSVYQNSKNATNYYYKFENFSTIDEVIEYDLYNPNEFYTESKLIKDIMNEFLYNTLIFIIFLFIGILLFISIIYINIYNRFIKPFLDIKSSKAQEFVEVNKNLKIKETQIYNQKEDLYKINKYITHEFKNSLMALKGKLYIDKEDAASYIDDISKQIEDLNALTTDKVDLVDVDFLLICAEVIEDFDKNIEFLFEDEDFTTHGNTTLIYRVLYNIIENAFKYGADKVEVYVKKKDQNIICQITNNGPKMDEKKLDDIFKLNYRINKLNQNGSGIGLSLVKNVMDILGGSIFVTSGDEKTTFYLSFVSTDNR